jgi:hypothetical protein
MNTAVLEESLAAIAPWGCYEFYTLCDKLQESYPQLYAVMYRDHRALFWVAEIHTFHAGDARSQNSNRPDNERGRRRRGGGLPEP